MSYTNKTPNFELPQYVADDKPSYLGDFNQAMLKIDTDMKTIDNKATEAQSTSSNANSTATEALSTAQSASTSASSANTTATQAKQMAQNAQTDATNAISTANSANTSANEAKENASGANNMAENAQSLAQSAKSVADTANSKANENTQDILELKEAIANWNFQVITNPDNVNSAVFMSFNKTLKLMQIYGYVDSINSKQIKIGTIPMSLVRALKNVDIYGGCFYSSSGGDYKPVLMQVNTSNEIYVPNQQNYEEMTQLRFNVTLCLADTENWQIL